MKTFKDYYKFPLKQMLGLESVKVLTNDNKMAFDWCQKLPEWKRKDLLSTINGNICMVMKINSSIHYSYKDGIVYYDKDPLLRIRGWGHLIGIKCLRLSVEKAKKIQDEFGEYIVKMLNK